MFSFSRYAVVLAVPGVKESFWASLLGRLPIGMCGLALLLLTQAAGGTYASSGLVTGAYVTGLAIIAPLLGRLIDRLGPRPVLRICSIAYPTALVLLTIAVLQHLSLWGVAPIAACAGASLPPITVSQRALLRRKLNDDQLLTTALTLDAVVIELIFVTGPLLVASLVALASPAAALLAAAVSALAGSTLYLRSASLGDWDSRQLPDPSAPFLGALRTPGLPYLLVAAFAYATVFGLVEIALAAYAKSIGKPALAGVLLGLMSVGSAAAGLAYGSRHWHRPLGHRMSGSLLLMGLGLVPLVLINDPRVFTVCSALAGATMAPPLIIQSTYIAKTVAVDQITEGFTWSATALLCGVAVGLALGGVLLEYGTASHVMAVAVACSLASAAWADRKLHAPAI
ncbi:MAG TPA: MFS transporter [Burkholderiales bacterium]|nr:MFS transporter [Burkholderiales bacterium]